MAQTFITKGTGERKKFKSGMQRDVSQTKPRFDLITPKNLPYQETMLYRWADLMQRGAQRYSARNWEKAEGEEELERFRESAYRHFMQWFCGETDEDHACAVMFNLSGAEFVKWKMQQTKHLPSKIS